MGILTNLQKAIAYRAAKELYPWIEAVSGQLDGETIDTSYFLSSAGSDANDGLTAAKPLKTFARLSQIIGPISRTAGDIVINVGSSPPTDALNMNVGIADGTGLAIRGTPVVQATGTLTGVTVANVGANTPWSIADAGLAGGWAAHVGKLVRITGGARAGNYARVVKDLGAGAARISPFGNVAVGVGVPAFQVVTPVIGDPYEILSPPTVRAGGLNFRLLSQSGVVVASSFLRNAVTFDGVTLDGNTMLAGVDGRLVPVVFKQSIGTGLYMGSDYVIAGGGGFDGSAAGIGSLVNLDGVGVMGNFLVYQNASAVALNNTIFQNAALSCGGTLTVFGLSFFDRAAANNTLLVNQGGYCRASGATWGTANAGHGVIVTSGSRLSYNTKPTVNATLGAGREAQVGGTDKLWAAIPYVEATNNAAIVAEA